MRRCPSMTSIDWLCLVRIHPVAGLMCLVLRLFWYLKLAGLPKERHIYDTMIQSLYRLLMTNQVYNNIKLCSSFDQDGSTTMHRLESAVIRCFCTTRVHDHQYCAPLLRIDLNARHVRTRSNASRGRNVLYPLPRRTWQDKKLFPQAFVCSCMALQRMYFWIMVRSFSEIASIHYARFQV